MTLYGIMYYKFEKSVNLSQVCVALRKVVAIMLRMVIIITAIARLLSIGLLYSCVTSECTAGKDSCSDRRYLSKLC